MYVCINTGFKNHFLTDLPSFILSLVPCFDLWMGQRFVLHPHHFIPSLAVFQYGKRQGCWFWLSCQVVSSSVQIGNVTLWSLTSFSSTATMLETRVQRVNITLCPTVTARYAIGSDSSDPSTIVFKFPVCSRKFSRTGQLFIEEINIKNNLERSGKTLSSFPTLC